MLVTTKTGKKQPKSVFIKCCHKITLISLNDVYGCFMTTIREKKM